MPVLTAMCTSAAAYKARRRPLMESTVRNAPGRREDHFAASNLVWSSQPSGQGWRITRSSTTSGSAVSRSTTCGASSVRRGNRQGLKTAGCGCRLLQQRGLRRRRNGGRTEPFHRREPEQVCGLVEGPVPLQGVTR